MSLASAAPPPPEWVDGDLKTGIVRVHLVEVARFPSEALAEGVRSSLEQAGWGPTRLIHEPNGSVAVCVGELESAYEAEHLRLELTHQRIAEARLRSIPIPATMGSFRGFTGPLTSPFTPGRLVELQPSQAIAGLEKLSGLSDEESAIIMAVRDAAEGREGAPTGSVLARLQVEAAQLLWARRLEPEVALHLTAAVARGDVPVSAESRLLAQRLTADLLYGHRRDWRAAWASARVLAVESPDPEVRAEARLRQAALIVELVGEGVEGTSFADARRILRRAWEVAPDGLSERSFRRMAALYLQTFAWEGNWDRADLLARAFLARFGADHAEGVVARTVLAQCYERKDLLQRSRELLLAAMATNLTEDQFFRLGNTLRDPRQSARLLMNRLSRIEAGLDPAPLPVTVQEEQQALEDSPAPAGAPRAPTATTTTNEL
jgi:hypothetical protein